MRSCRLLLRSEDPKNLRERAQSSCWVLGGCRGRLLGVFLLFFYPFGAEKCSSGALLCLAGVGRLHGGGEDAGRAAAQRPHQRHRAVSPCSCTPRGAPRLFLGGF